MSSRSVDKLSKNSRTSVIGEVREMRKTLLRALCDSDGLRNLIEKQIYPDTVHFIYELLQNAEDAGATNVSFNLSTTDLRFQHNGRPFSRDDIISITDIGASSKSSQVEMIGKFGVGFKSVFAYSESPRIWSPTYSFQIDNLVMPSLLESKPELGDLTQFEFLFNNPKKNPVDAYDEISRGLRDLTETTLLFLNNISSIDWNVENGETGSIRRAVHQGNEVEVIKTIGSVQMESSHFLIFSEPVKGHGASSNLKASVAFLLEFLPEYDESNKDLPLYKKMKLSPTDGKVAVYFTAKKEVSGLRFHLHAPFATELSRASVTNAAVNDPLFELLADISVKSLHQIRDLGLLGRDFFEVLPNTKEKVGEKYKQIRDRIIHEFSNASLTPTYDGRYAPAKQLVQARESLKKLISCEDLEFFIGSEPGGQPTWAATRAMKGSNTDRFMTDIKIREWDLNDFVRALRSNLSKEAPNDSYVKWLQMRKNDWFQMLYCTLDEDAPSASSALRDTLIVRLSDGNMETPKCSYFPDSEGVYVGSMPCIDFDLLMSQSTKIRENTKNFLKRLGVKEIDEYQITKALLDKHYRQEESSMDISSNITHIMQFIKTLKNNAGMKPELSKYRIFIGEDERWHSASGIFIDQPFLDTGMSEYYRCSGSPRNYSLLSKVYREASIDTDSLVDFVKLLGGHTSILVKQTNCEKNPRRSYLHSSPGKNMTATGTDRDWIFRSFDMLISSMNFKISKLIWNTIVNFEKSGSIDHYFYAVFRKSTSRDTHTALSQLVYQLRDNEWVPQGEGFVKPCDARKELLPSDFAFQLGSTWIKNIEFGKNIEIEMLNKDEKIQRQHNALTSLGIDESRISEVASIIEKLKEVPAENYSQLMKDIENSCHVFPTRTSENADRRFSKVKEMAEGAPGRVGKTVDRTVQVDLSKVKKSAETYLRHMYGSGDNVICQICRRPMPFLLEDGSPYFEKTEFLRKLGNRHYMNYLALCPNDSAMFLHANKCKDNMVDIFRSIVGNKIEVILAREVREITFTDVHIRDIMAVIEGDRN